MRSKYMFFIVTMAVILALVVVTLGAYTRLTNAGLGCPDWPGCYGNMVLPSSHDALTAAQQQYPSSHIEVTKAWTEMAHRYAAGSLAILILIISMAWIGQRFCSRSKYVSSLPLILLILVIFQAALGMWTVTLKLLPVVVMCHLLGGLLIFSLLSCLRVQMSTVISVFLPKWHVWIGVALVVLLLQISLGGWVSANYAGIACVGFPQCNGQWWPNLHLSQGFYFFSPVGANYQGGMLENEARVTIQFIHRLGALFTAVCLLTLSSVLLTNISYAPLRRAAWVLIVLVIVQFLLGILNVMYLLPIGVAVAHNGVAALLLATLFIMFYLTKGKMPHAQL